MANIATSDDDEGRSEDDIASSRTEYRTLHEAALHGNVRRVQALLRAGANVNALEKGRKPLHHAAAAGHIPSVCELLRAQADVNTAEFDAQREKLQRKGDCQEHIFPAIDISPFVDSGKKEEDEVRKETAQTWDEVFRTTGFGLISGHDVSTELLRNLVDGIRAFFSRSQDYKMHYSSGPNLSCKSGYSPIGGAPDPFEGYTLIRHRVARWSTGERHPPELAGVLEKYAYAAERVMHAVNRMSALALNMDMHYFDQFYHRPANVLVVNHYPAPSSLKGKGYTNLEEKRRRYRPHSDYTGFTILLQDGGDHQDGSGGLEIDISGAWVPIHPRDNCFVVNIGDFFENWTNNRWRSTPHRVTAPHPDSKANDRSRFTVALFSGPDLEATVSPIPTCVTRENPRQFPPVLARDLLATNAITKSKEAVYEQNEALQARRAG